METLLRIGTARGQIDFGVATTRGERAAVLAQRFRVYQRYGYYRAGLEVDRDEYDRKAVYLTATVGTGRRPDMLIGSARLVVSEAENPFIFPSQKAFQFELPAAIREVASRQCAEVTRFVSERPEGIVAGGLLVPLGLIQAVSVYSRRHTIRCGLAVVKQRLLRALCTAGVPLSKIASAKLVYPEDGPTGPYYHRHADPVIPVWWIADQLAPFLERALARYQWGPLPARALC